MKYRIEIREGGGDCECCGGYTTLSVRIPEISYEYHTDTHHGEGRQLHEVLINVLKVLGNTVTHIEAS